MSVIYNENAAHRAAILAAEQARQAACVPGASQATIHTAEVAFYRACLSSATTNGVSPMQFIVALKELGTGGV